MNKTEIPVDPRYVWVAYSARSPYLPIAVADTPAELAALMGIHRTTVCACWLRYRRGQQRRSRYHRVKILAEGVC